MIGRALLLSLLVAGLGGGSLAFASTLNGVTAHSLTVFSAASTVPTSSCSSTSTVDTWIDSGHKNTQHAGATTMDVIASSTAYSLVRFAPCASANAAVVSASLQLTMTSSPGAGRTYGAYPILSSWTESTAWRDGTTISGSVSATATTPGGAGGMNWSSATLNADVQSWVNGGTNWGWAIEDNGAGTSTGIFSTLESASGKPALSITYYP